MIDIPIAELLGASVLTLGGIVLILIALALVTYVRQAGKNVQTQSNTEYLREQNFAEMIKIQRGQQRLMRRVSVKTTRIEKQTDTNIKVLRLVAKQLKRVSQEQVITNGNAKTINQLVEKLDRYLEGKAT